MERLGLSLLLALGCHVVLFGMILPEPQEYIPVLQGKKQVVVSLDRKVALPVESPPDIPSPIEPEPESEPEPERVEEPEEKIEKNIDSDPVTEVEPVPSPELKPVSRKSIPKVKPLPRDRAKNEAIEHVDMPRSKAERTAKVEPVQLAQEGNESIAEQTVVTGKAVPLAENNVPPEYPGLARRRGWEGTVMLEVDVREDGQVRSVRIKASSTYVLLDNAARDAVNKWQFLPGTINGRPVAMTVLVPVHFILKDAL